MKIVFFGTPQFAARILKHLFDQGCDIVAVVTRPDRPRGRSQHIISTPVKEIAQSYKASIPVFQPEKASNPEFAATLASFEADLFVVVAYGEILKQNILNLPKLGCINIHASLLPKYRGAAPMQRCLMDGVSETGITIMEMVLQMDAGDMIEVAKVPVPEDMTLGELEEKLCVLSCDTLINVLKCYEMGTIKKTPQNHQEASFAPKITPQEEEIDWKLSALQIHNKVRALSPFPGAWCTVKIGDEIKRLKIKRSKVIESSRGAPGDILSSGKDGLIICCGAGALSLLDVQLEGKKQMSCADFLKGIHQPISFLVK